MSHDDFQPPDVEHPSPTMEDRIYALLSELAGVDTHDVDLRDHTAAWEPVEKLLTHAYTEGRKDQFEQECEFLMLLIDCIDQSLAGEGGARIAARDLILSRLPLLPEPQSTDSVL